MQRFVDASAIGWANYLSGDNAAANARIKRDNPEMTDARIAYSIAKMKEHGIVDSGDTMKGGIGAMTDARMKSFFDKMVAAGVVKGAIDYKKAYSLQFVNKGVGVDQPWSAVGASSSPAQAAVATTLARIRTGRRATRWSVSVGAANPPIRLPRLRAAKGMLAAAGGSPRTATKYGTSQAFRV